MALNPKQNWEFHINRAFLPLPYTFTVFSNHRGRIRRYLDIPGDGLTGQIMCPDDIFRTTGLFDQVVHTQMAHHREEGNTYLWKMAHACEENGTRLLDDLSREFGAAKLSEMSSDELEGLFGWSVEETQNFCVFLVIPLWIEEYLNSLVVPIAGKSTEAVSQEEVLAKLLSPFRTNDSSLETPALWALAVEIERSDALRDIFSSSDDIEESLGRDHPEFLAKVDDFILNYGWIHVRWFIGAPITRTDVIARLAHVLTEDPEGKLRDRQRESDDARKYLEAFSLEQSLSGEERDTVLLVKEYKYIRTFRTDTLSRAFFHLLPILLEISRRLSVPMDDMLYYSEHELREKLLGEIVSVDVDLRREGWAALVIGDEYEMYSGKDAAEELRRDSGVVREFEEVNSLSGKRVYKGRVTGRAKIVISPRDLLKVEKGDVLVAVMTFPSYVVAMERAAAFVTDDGGILCHASILAREMKKPCIIGTKFATKVLHDGDLVEVDADNGVVRIVS